MSYSFPSWLTKKMLKGASGFNLDAYLMALEGWRRGLTLTWYYEPSEVTDMKIIGFNPLGKTFSLYDEENDKKHYFYRSRGDKVDNRAVDIVHDKFLAKSYLQDAGVPSPKGIMIKSENQESEIIQQIKHLCYPLVVKPVLGSLGKGVVTDIQNQKELLDSITYVRNNFDYEDLIIEEHFQGDEYRIYVVGDKVAAATKRIPANVTGDGKSTVKELIDKKNEHRKDNPYLSRKLIKIDESLMNYIKKNNQTLESVPAEHEIVYLKGQSNISSGGDPLDVTDSLPNDIKNVAMKAVEAIPGLVHAGVDVMSNGTNTLVIEVNATAEIPMHTFPLEGKPRNVAEYIMDYYFPETTGMAQDRTEIYFEYRKINRSLRQGIVQKVELTDAPAGKLYKARYIVYGKVQGKGYRAWIRRQAVKQGLHGYTRNLKNGNVVVIVGGHDKNIVDNFKQTCLQGSPRSKVENVKKLSWNKPIKLGFEIRKTK